MVELLQPFVKLSKIPMESLWINIEKLIFSFLFCYQVKCEHHTLLLLICDRLSPDLGNLKVIEYVFESLELLVRHPCFCFLLLILNSIFGSFSFDRAWSWYLPFLSELNFKLIFHADAWLFVTIFHLECSERRLLLARPNIPSFFRRGCQHVLKFRGAFFVILSQRGYVQRDTRDT